MNDSGGEDPTGAGGKLTLYLFGGLDELTPRGDVAEMDADVGSVAGLLETLRLPEEDVGLVLVNGQQASLDSHVKPGDEIALFPPIG